METKLIWLDLEMTGLDPEKEVILEIASIITNEELEILAEGPNLAIKYPDNILNNMNSWSKVHHKASGLIEKVKNSVYSCKMAEKETLKFINIHCEKGMSPLCGNTIWQDRRFLIKYMPKLEEFFHYRNIDVSSIKELVKRWFPSLPAFEKKNNHTALSDVVESIEELKYYRKQVFIDSLE